ncbi:MAG: hypothetical protein L0209_05950 [candidate division Zixibacteria bacterium]|nr:hypothetical protein [candidate division Zixibacteria bacterium]
MKKLFLIKNLAGPFLFFLAAEVSAVPRTIQLFDSTRIAGNSIVEIVATSQGVWLATERGIAYTTDNGVTWRNFDRDETGDLLSNEIAALGVRGDTLWAATSFTRVFGNETEGFQSVPFGTGFAVTGNQGASWAHFTPDQDSGAGMLAFDLSFSDSAVWAASFFGGLVRSTDGGVTWINAFADSLAKFDFETQSFINRNNRFFSVAADTFRANDTIAVWAGSAAGLNKFVYLPRRLELADNRIFDIAFDGSRHWFGTADGLSYSPDTGKSFVSLASTTFPGFGAVSALYADGSQILAGFTDDDSLRNGAGLYRSTNGGVNWAPIASPYVSGTGRVVRQIVRTDSGFYAAADQGGLLFSRDGVNWQNLFPDPELAQKNRQFLSIASFNPTADSLILLGGTRFGLATMIFTTDPASFDSLAYMLADTSIANLDTLKGNRIEKVAVGKFKDTLAFWGIAHPDAFPETFSAVRSTDRGRSWSNRFAAIPAYEIAFQDSAVWLGVFDSLLFSDDNGLSFKSVLVRDTVTKLSLARRTVRALLTDSNSVWAGTTNGVGFTTSDSGQNWGVFRTEKEEAHKVQRYFFSLTSPTVPGNFGVVLGVQKRGSTKAVWVGSHTTDLAGERSGVARSLDDGATWSVYFLDTLAWNFAFWGDTVWVATSSGLFRSPDMGQSWQHIPIAGVDAYSGAATSFSGAVEILSVRQVDDTTVWAGSTDGAAVSFDLGQNWKIFRRFLPVGKGLGTANADVYASPVPFSPQRGLGICRFHYRPTQNSNVTIEIFDFAMRRVATVIENEPRAGGKQYYEQWNGRNEKGEMVANGTYFFRISGIGEKQWGKLVVLK